MYSLGLVGFPLEHSLSPLLHTAALKAVELKGKYLLYPIMPADKQGLNTLLARFRRGEIHGLNITIPHKQTVIPLLDELTPTAKAIRAVNTIFKKDGLLFGDNTDAEGFMNDLKKMLRHTTGGTALVLGAGGSARAVVYALLSIGWNVVIAARRKDQADALVSSMKSKTNNVLLRSILLGIEEINPILEQIRLVVNTTPVGMSPHSEFSPWPKNLSLPDDAIVYDLVYNPRQTCFVREALTAGLCAQSGLGMLVEQAALAFSIWTGHVPPRDIMFAAVEG